MKPKILFVSHVQKQCGVHEFGNSVISALKSSSVYEFIYTECGSMNDLDSAIKMHSPYAIIYNYYTSTLPWLTKKALSEYGYANTSSHIPQLGIMHEVTQQKADAADNDLFDYHIAPDPTLLLKNPIVFKTGRLVPEYDNHYPIPNIQTIGSFGFATRNKGFEEIVRAVQHEFDDAIIRFNIPSADFADSDGSNAKRLVDQCRRLINKPGIHLSVSHNFLSREGILDFLAQNTVNIFLYQDKNNRGLSSTVDYALAVNRPLVISNSIMFRHLHNITPSIEYGKSSIREIVHHGSSSYNYLKEEWNSVNLIWEYERILNAVTKKEQQKKERPQDSSWKRFKGTIRTFLGLKTNTTTWLRNTENATEDILTPIVSKPYIPIDLPREASLNRILDNSARKLYNPAIIKLEELVPLTMAKKIPEANVQQAFVFDTVLRIFPEYQDPKILCVGSYEDTASMSLKRLGFKIEEVDPVLNYYLQEYYTKPGIDKNSYEIIFSTSVIEHDPDDESFMKCIEGLLKPGGTAILTCDYKDGWKMGEPKPEVDARFYTMQDLKKRLLSYIPTCRLVDTPRWECNDPDFNYQGKYQYTFATFVIRKNK